MNFQYLHIVSPLSHVKPEKVRINVDAANYIAISRPIQVGKSIMHLAGGVQHALEESIEIAASALSEKIEGVRILTSGNLSAQERRVYVNLKQVCEISNDENRITLKFLDGSSDLVLEPQPEFFP